MSYPFIRGAWSWEGEQDETYNREYKLTYLIESLPTQGPASVLQTPGLPIPGTIWSLGDDLDIWAWVRPNARVTPLCTGEPNKFWKMELTASTKPLKRCSELKVEDPLLEPPDIDLDTVRDTDTSGYDAEGKRITTSSHEQFPGKETEFDKGRSQLKITLNVPTYEQVRLYEQYRDHVNKRKLWNHEPRCVKLSDVKAPRKMYGLCYSYWRMEATFDVNDKTFDKDLQDEGSKVLNGHWASTEGTGTGTGGTGLWVLDPVDGVSPDEDNPAHFIKATDRQGNPCHVVLDGHGRPAVNVGHKIVNFRAFPSDPELHIEIQEGDPGLVLGETLNIVGVRLGHFNNEYAVHTVESPTKFTVLSWVEDPDSTYLYDPPGGVGNLTYVGGGYVTVRGSGAGTRHIEGYKEADFLELLYGLPAEIV